MSPFEIKGGRLGGLSSQEGRVRETPQGAGGARGHGHPRLGRGGPADPRGRRAPRAALAVSLSGGALPAPRNGGARAPLRRPVSGRGPARHMQSRSAERIPTAQPLPLPCGSKGGGAVHAARMHAGGHTRSGWGAQGARSVYVSGTARQLQLANNGMYRGKEGHHRAHSPFSCSVSVMPFLRGGQQNARALARARAAVAPPAGRAAGWPQLPTPCQTPPPHPKTTGMLAGRPV